MPWLGSSVWGVQRVRSVSEAPADLRLKMNVPSQCGAEAKARRPRRLLPPLRPLDMVDLRTPSSMTLTWNAGDLRGQASEPLTQLRDLVSFKVPTVDGGNPVTSYQLYRDVPALDQERFLLAGLFWSLLWRLRLCFVFSFQAGDSSGIYTLAYARSLGERGSPERRRETCERGGDHGFGDSALPQQRQDLPLLRGGRERCQGAPKIIRDPLSLNVSQVGPGARTSVFSAEMRCTPRSLVAAPYKARPGAASSP